MKPRAFNQILHGWWMAIAQNVAPKRWQAHEDRKEMLDREQNPTFVVAGLPAPLSTDGFRAIPRSGRVEESAMTTLATQGAPGGGVVKTETERGGASLAMPGTGWEPLEVVVDGETWTFRRRFVGDGWVAVGVVGEFSITVRARQWEPARLELVRV